MKGLVLAGGAGTRLRPITLTRAKQLVPVANKPVLFYGLEHLAAAGIDEVGLVVGDTADEVRAAVGDGSAWGLRVTYLPQDAPLGLAHAVLIARDFLGDDDFVMYLGDNLLREGIAGLVAAFHAERRRAAEPTFDDPARTPPSAQILLARVANPERFGVAEFGPGGDLVRLVEKPAEPPSDYAMVGVYLFDATVHEAVRAITPSARGELEITEAVQWLIDHGHPVRYTVVTDWWKDTGSLEPLLEGNRLVLESLETRLDGTLDPASRVEGRVVLEPGSVLEGALVRGPAIVGRNTVVRDAYVGPFTAIGADCVVERSEVEHSIVLDRSRIVGVERLLDSLVGYDATVEHTGHRPHATRLMVGDHSHVELG